MLLHLIVALLCNYGKDPMTTTLVSTTDIYIMPTMNPDGYAKAYPYAGSCIDSG